MQWGKGNIVGEGLNLICTVGSKGQTHTSPIHVYSLSRSPYLDEGVVAGDGECSFRGLHHECLQGRHVGLEEL